MSEFETAKMAVIDLLQKNGALDSIKAQLRSSVLLALQSSTLNQGKNKPGKNSLGKSLLNKYAELAFLVKDFLHVLGLSNTAAVFEAEWGQEIESTEATRSITKLNAKDTLIGSVFRGYKNRSAHLPINPDGLSQGPVVSKLAIAPLNKDNIMGANPVKKTLPPDSSILPSKLLSSDLISTPLSSKPKSNDEDESKKMGIALSESLQILPASSTKSSIETPSRLENKLPPQIDSDVMQVAKKKQIDSSSAKPISEDWDIKGEISAGKAPRQRYRSNNQTEEFFSPTLNDQSNLKSEKTQVADRDEESEQHSSERSATKVSETEIDYFEPVIKDL